VNQKVFAHLKSEDTVHHHKPRCLSSWHEYFILTWMFIPFYRNELIFSRCSIILKSCSSSDVLADIKHIFRTLQPSI